MRVSGLACWQQLCTLCTYCMYNYTSVWAAQEDTGHGHILLTWFLKKFFKTIYYWWKFLDNRSSKLFKSKFESLALLTKHLHIRAFRVFDDILASKLLWAGCLLLHKMCGQEQEFLITGFWFTGITRRSVESQALNIRLKGMTLVMKGKCCKGERNEMGESGCIGTCQTPDCCTVLDQMSFLPIILSLRAASRTYQWS